MLIGLNWSATNSFSIIKKILNDGVADFCEILLDNVIHISPEMIQQALPNIPFAFHIMNSRFLEQSRDELKFIAGHVRHWIDVLNPIYVSDHIARFSNEKKNLSVVAEMEYEKDYSYIKNQVRYWQKLLDVQIQFENFPSMISHGKNQVMFYEKLLRETGAGLLFDFSNAYIADLNQVCPLNKWDSLINKTKNFHVSGFRLTKSGYAIDSHDVEIADEVLNIIKTSIKNCHERKSIVVEFDHNC